MNILNNFQINQKLSLYFCRSYLFVMILHIIYKANYNSITTDEAYTYLEYVYTNDIFNIGVANNHVLNSFLMLITTFFGTTEFFLRLPNVLSGIAYLTTIGYLIKDIDNKVYMTLVLTSPIYLIEFFTLARGYGIASFLIFFGSVNYYILKPYKYNFLVSCLCFILAALSIHIYIIFSAFFIIVNFKFEIIKNLNVFISSVIMFLFFSYFIVTFTFLIGRPGHLYGAENLSILELIGSVFGFIELFQIKSFIFLIPIYLLFLMPVASVFSSTFEAKSLYLISFLSLGSLFILPIIFDQPFPIRRVLIPLLPPFLLCNVIIFENIPKFKYKSLVSHIFSILLVLNMFLNLDTNSTIDWGESVDKNFLSCTEDAESLDAILFRPALYYQLLNSEVLIDICK